MGGLSARVRCGLLALAVGLPVAAQADADWASVWARLDGLRELEAESPAAVRMAGELAGVARAHAADPRGRLVAAQLDRIAGRPPAPGVLDELARLPLEAFEGRAIWLLAEVLPPGPQRVRAALQALAMTDSPTPREVRIAWNVAVDEARALRLAEGASPIQEVLFERFPAPWSAIDLALTRTWLGDAAGVDAVLAQAIAREEAAGRPAADLWSQRGIAALGFGDEARARDYLGRALARGSEDASLVLGRLDLDAGRLEAARMEFRASILSDRPAAWALRGWGLTLLPRPQAAPEPPGGDER